MGGLERVERGSSQEQRTSRMEEGLGKTRRIQSRKGGGVHATPRLLDGLPPEEEGQPRTLVVCQVRHEEAAVSEFRRLLRVLGPLVDAALLQGKGQECRIGFPKIRNGSRRGSVVASRDAQLTRDSDANECTFVLRRAQELTSKGQTPARARGQEAGGGPGIHSG